MAHSVPATRRVLVLDGDSQASLSVVASLGSRGLDVTGGNDAPGSIGSRSRYVDREFVYSPAARRPGAFVDALATFLERTDHYAVLPTRDDTTTVVSRNKPRLAATGTAVGAEDWERFQRVGDKARTFELAAELSVRTPDTRAPDSTADVAALAPDLSYRSWSSPEANTLPTATAGFTRTKSVTTITPTRRPTSSGPTIACCTPAGERETRRRSSRSTFRERRRQSASPRAVTCSRTSRSTASARRRRPAAVRR